MTNAWQMLQLAPEGATLAIAFGLILGTVCIVYLLRKRPEPDLSTPKRVLDEPCSRCGCATDRHAWRRSTAGVTVGWCQSCGTGPCPSVVAGSGKVEIAFAAARRRPPTPAGLKASGVETRVIPLNCNKCGERVSDMKSLVKGHECPGSAHVDVAGNPVGHELDEVVTIVDGPRDLDAEAVPILVAEESSSGA